MRKVIPEKYYVVKLAYSFGILRGDRTGETTNIVSRGFIKYNDAFTEKIGLEAKEKHILISRR